MSKKTIAVLVLASAWGLSVSTAHSQEASSKDSPTVSDKDVQLLRQDIRSSKKQLVAANLTLTDAELLNSGPSTTNMPRKWPNSAIRNTP
jgi:hypothetical protein